jgi:hypothetical protein
MKYGIKKMKKTTKEEDSKGRRQQRKKTAKEEDSKGSNLERK